MWKKTAALCLVVCLLLALAACQRARVPGLDWDAEEMVELRLERVMYLVGEKTTTDPQEIQAVAEGLRSVAVLREWRPDDPCSEGSGSLLPKDASPTQDELWALVDVPVEFPPEHNHTQPDEETAEFFGF